MNKKEFNSRVVSVTTDAMTAISGKSLESTHNWFGTPVTNVFIYGAISERNMERQLMELKGCKRKTTFMSDLSVAEWCGWRSLLYTIKNVMKSWKDDETYIAEFVLCVNWKAWEHSARGNDVWAAFYSALYEGVRDLMYDYYEGDDKKTSYLFEYLD